MHNYFAALKVRSGKILGELWTMYETYRHDGMMAWLWHDLKIMKCNRNAILQVSSQQLTKFHCQHCETKFLTEIVQEA